MPLERVRVLVIDDDAFFGFGLARRLEEAGFAARFHRGPFGCLQAIRDMRCEAVVLDVNMPRLDGPLVLRMIRDAMGMGTTRVLLCSNMEAEPLARLAAVSGAHGSLTKGAIDAELVPSIHAMLGATLARSAQSREASSRAVGGSDAWQGRGPGR
ncbi:response regulator [Polyangium sp. y55x31]|uniref:response regulator n=1 Tax=Polyangium sp. y55x31 TaxID=3042688 RepID=UPI0024830979|nr:response regulator [Polyangium sp. y55x31]MDI1477349.1 response regulator [Polyangium sp. y55x31]